MKDSIFITLYLRGLWLFWHLNLLLGSEWQNVHLKLQPPGKQGLRKNWRDTSIRQLRCQSWIHECTTASGLPKLKYLPFECLILVMTKQMLPRGLSDNEGSTCELGQLLGPKETQSNNIEPLLKWHINTAQDSGFILFIWMHPLRAACDWHRAGCHRLVCRSSSLVMLWLRVCHLIECLELFHCCLTGASLAVSPVTSCSW